MRVVATLAAVSSLVAVLGTAGAALADHQTDEYRITVFPSHPIFGRRDWIGIGYLGYVTIPEGETEVGYLGAGAIWKFANWGELWSVLIATWTRSETATDVDELRPVLGIKANFAKVGKTTFFEFFRAEYRIQDRATGDDTEYLRIRNRIGFERPFGDRPYDTKSWYGLADVENFYRFDRGISDLARLRLGAGYVLSDRVRVELLYHMQFERADSNESFDWTDNIFRINFKLARKQGLLRRVFDGGGDVGDD